MDSGFQNGPKIGQISDSGFGLPTLLNIVFVFFKKKG